MIESNIVTLFQFNILYRGMRYEFQISSNGKLMYMGADKVPEKVWRLARQLSAVNHTAMEKQRARATQSSIQGSLW